jgi:hypothetical protein
MVDDGKVARENGCRLKLPVQQVLPASSPWFLSWPWDTRPHPAVKEVFSRFPRRLPNNNVSKNASKPLGFACHWTCVTSRLVAC